MEITNMTEKYELYTVEKVAVAIYQRNYWMLSVMAQFIILPVCCEKLLSQLEAFLLY